jgi:ATP-dependent Lhr-like helicase
VLSAFEETGRARRGYFVEGLGAAQFSTPGAVDRVRAAARAAEEARDARGRGGADDPTGWAGAPGALPVAAWADGPLPGGLTGAPYRRGRPERDEPPSATHVLAASDPANPYGAALGWPSRGEDGGGHKPGRKAGAVVVLHEGELALYVERGGRSLLTWTDDLEVLRPAVQALAVAVREGALGRLTVERADGGGVLDSPLGGALEAAGFHATPRGLRLRA